MSESRELKATEKAPHGEQIAADKIASWGQRLCYREPSKLDSAEDKEQICLIGKAFDKLNAAKNASANHEIKLHDALKTIVDPNASDSKALSAVLALQAAAYIARMNGTKWDPTGGNDSSDFLIDRTIVDDQAMDKLNQALPKIVGFFDTRLSLTRDNKIFNKLDKNNNGLLSASEIKQALAEPNIDPRLRSSLAFISEYFSDATHGINMTSKDDGISKSDLKKLVEAEVAKPAWAALDAGGDSIKRFHDSAPAYASGNVFAHEKAKLQDIVASAIVQGEIGDCHFEGPVLALAVTSPERLPAITRKGKDAYAISFPILEGGSLTVSRPTRAEMSIFQTATTYGLWSSVIEKGYATILRQIDPNEAAHKPEANSLPPQMFASFGHMPSTAIRALTGHDTAMISPTNAPDQVIARAISETLSARRIAVADSLYAPKNPELDHLHTFAITEFDPHGPDGGTITLLNPHGDDYQNYKIKVSVHDFGKDFREVIVELDQKSEEQGAFSADVLKALTQQPKETDSNKNVKHKN